MSDWKDYLTDSDTKPLFKRKKQGPGCKRNRISKNRFGPCSFNENDICEHCSRPRRKELRLDPNTNTIIVHYFE